jgi:hypothetical protein
MSGTERPGNRQGKVYVLSISKDGQGLPAYCQALLQLRLVRLDEAYLRYQTIDDPVDQAVCSRSRE